MSLEASIEAALEPEPALNEERACTSAGLLAVFAAVSILAQTYNSALAYRTESAEHDARGSLLSVHALISVLENVWESDSLSTR